MPWRLAAAEFSRQAFEPARENLIRRTGIIG